MSSGCLVALHVWGGVTERVLCVERAGGPAARPPRNSSGPSRIISRVSVDVKLSVEVECFGVSGCVLWDSAGLCGGEFAGKRLSAYVRDWGGVWCACVMRWLWLWVFGMRVVEWEGVICVQGPGIALSAPARERQPFSQRRCTGPVSQRTPRPPVAFWSGFVGVEP